MLLWFPVSLVSKCSIVMQWCVEARVHFNVATCNSSSVMGVSTVVTWVSTVFFFFFLILDFFRKRPPSKICLA